MPVSWIQRNERLILYSDYRGLKSEEKMLETLKEEEKFYQKTNIKILSLNDYRDTYISKKFMDEITEVGKRNKGRTLRAAILGVSGLKKIFLNGYSSITGENLRAFDNEEDAFKYLTSG